VVDRGGLENRCALYWVPRVRIPPSPPLFPPQRCARLPSAEFKRPRGVKDAAGYVFVDYGDQFRRDHAVAFATIGPAAVTLASSHWAIDHLSRWGGSGYLPRRHRSLFERDRRARVLASSPVLRQALYLVENTEVTRHWPWFAEAIAAIA
jgi:hypothetical protein